MEIASLPGLFLADLLNLASLKADKKDGIMSVR